MKHFYIYNLFKKEQGRIKCIVILFCPEGDLQESILKIELKDYFSRNILPDELVVIGGKYLETDLRTIFIENAENTFQNINKAHKPDLLKSITVFLFDEDGTLGQLTKKKINKTIYREYINDGLINIFKKRGGLIEAHQGQHYVFPSGKHSAKFLRTGNILLYSAEIYFIAFSILKYFSFEKHKYIFCDTSSINSLALALVDLKQRFHNETQRRPLINSFKSYSVFEEEEIILGKNALFLVSSSTSGGIIQRFKDKKTNIPAENVVLIYFLGEDENYERFKSHIVCNLTKSVDGDHGIEKFDAYNFSNCRHCRDGSIALNVVGDTFLSEKPKINKVLLTISHAPKNLSSFVEQFICDDRNQFNIIKCHFKENPEPEEQYDIYIDMEQIFDSIINQELRYSDYDKKLRKRINLNIPSNTKYIITLEDSGSKQLALLILKEFKKTHKKPPVIISQNEIKDKVKNIDGSAVIACSSMVNGGNLLYISKILRQYSDLSSIYFVGLIRTKNEQYHDFLNKNLSQGSTLGSSNSPFIAIESLYIPEKFSDTTWLNEKKFLNKIVAYLNKDQDLENPKYSEEALYFFEKRLEMFKSVDSINKGLSNNLFFPNIFDDFKELILNKNFAFLNFELYYSRISQAEVYFIISAILNNLRNNIIKGVSLIQLENERNVLDPGNFLRFNDGIIQACVLRAALKCELDYSLEENLSSQVRDIILDIIKNDDIVMRESLMEFSYALASKKMKLVSEHMNIVVNKIKKLDNELLTIMFDDLEERNILC